MLKCLQLVCGSFADRFQLDLKCYVKLLGYYVKTALNLKGVNYTVIEICAVGVNCTAEQINADYDGSADADKRCLAMLPVGT